ARQILFSRESSSHEELVPLLAANVGSRSREAAQGFLQAPCVLLEEGPERLEVSLHLSGFPECARTGKQNPSKIRRERGILPCKEPGERLPHWYRDLSEAHQTRASDPRPRWQPGRLLAMPDQSQQVR